MSYKGYLVVDSDSHMNEDWDLDAHYKPNMDPAYRDQYDRFRAAVLAKEASIPPGPGGSITSRALGQLFWPRIPTPPLGVYDEFEAQSQRGDSPRPEPRPDHACSVDPSVRLREMDIGGVDVSVMFPSYADGFCMLRDVGFEGALHRSYHRFMSDYCSEAGGRLRWIGCSTMRDVSEAVDQLRYWAEHDDNFAGMHLTRACPDGRLLDNPDLYPLYEASQELDLPLWVHGGANRPPVTPWIDAPNWLYHSLGGQYAMAALIGGGIFDLFPNLRIGFFESGGSWMLYLVERLDAGYVPGSARTPKQKRAASEIVAGGHLFCAIEADEQHIPYAVESLGEHVWLFSTDYPHGGTSWPNGVRLIREQEMAEGAKIKLFGENAKRFLPRLASAVASAPASE